MISILLPTRERPEMLLRFVVSVQDTADHPENIEFIVHVDDDDSSYDGKTWPREVKIEKSPRRILATCWEWERATGDILAYGSDDFVFHTKGWDTKVVEEFDKYPDKILLVGGYDGDPNRDKVNITLGFIHRNWVEVVGRFFPPYFSGDFVDTWISDVAEMIGRRVRIDIDTEHIHPAFNKREQDQTDKTKWEKHFKDDMPQKYLDTMAERLEEVEKLRKFIEDHA